jgi:hypothetical protein
MLKNGIILCALVALSACGDPLRDMPRLSDVDIAETDPVAQALPTEAEVARKGFFGTSATASADGVLTAPAAPQPRRGGLLGLLRGDVAVVQDSTQTAAVTAPPAAPSGVEAPDVTYGTVLPFGTVARVCDARRQPLGRKVESASARGYKLYDSAPGTPGPRTYYITGFADDCPRQLTAAHVVLGSPSFYEVLHYGPTGAHLVTGATDRAYEQVKARVCGTRAGTPCGSRMRQLERDTFFVNAYERMDDNTRWSELLVHDGAVVAAALKTN